MRDYKVGDTIYIKDTVADITPSDKIATYRGYYNGWVATKTIIDELPAPEPTKPVLPKDVADEMSYAKSINDITKDITFDDYIISKLIYSDDSATNKMIQSSDIPNAIEALLNAWNNGYTVEKPKLYNLILNEDYYKGAVVCLYKPIQSYELHTISSINDDNLKHNKKYQFTQEEIDKYNEDFWIKNIDLNNYKELVADD